MRLSGFLVIMTMLLIACSSEPKITELTTDKGNKVTFYIDEPGEVIGSGQYFLFHAATYLGDEMVDDTHLEAKPRRYQLPTPERLENNQSPIIDAFQYMSEGDSARIEIPAGQARRLEGYQEGMEAFYTIVIKDVLTTAEYQGLMDAENATVNQQISEVQAKAEQILADYNAGALDDQIVTLDSGLKYVVHEEGNGTKPQAGDKINAQYYGMLMDGTMFDTSYKRGRPFSFEVGRGQVISGWDQGFMSLEYGSTATLFIPSEMGYGAAGSGPIPPNSDLVFYVELLEG